MRILVVCGAGASSTFVAQRLRAAALAEGEPFDVSAGSESTLHVDLGAGVDVVLVGPHLHADFSRIASDAEHVGAHAVLLPPDVFTDRTGAGALALVRGAVTAPGDTRP